MTFGVVIPAEAGIHTALTEDEHVVARTGGEIPCVTAGAGSLPVDGFRGNPWIFGPALLASSFTESRMRERAKEGVGYFPNLSQ